MPLSVSLGYRKLIGLPGPIAFNACSPLIPGGDRFARTTPQIPGDPVCVALRMFESVNAHRLRVMTESATGWAWVADKSRAVG